MYNQDKERLEIACFTMRKFPQLMRRYFETAAVMRTKGLVPFLHAQHSALRAAPIFLETLAGRSSAKPFKYFRNPSKEFEVDRSTLWNKIANSNFEVSSHTLSMSYSIFETQPEESASYFLFSNASVDGQSCIEPGRRVIAEALRRRGVQVSDTMRILERFCEQYAQLKLGTLYLIGIPQERLDRFVYDSEAYGKPTGIDVRQAIDCHVHSEWNHTAPQARLMFYNETMDTKCGLEAVDISDAKETEHYAQAAALEPSELFNFFFPDPYSEVEEADERDRTQIDSEVRRFANSIKISQS